MIVSINISGPLPHEFNLQEDYRRRIKRLREFLDFNQ